MRVPDVLKKGDQVGLIAPSGPVIEERFHLGVEIVKKIGLLPVIGKSCTAKKNYLAGDDETRKNDINRMFADPAIKGIFALRGGYGAQRILNELNWDMIRANPKIFVGYSDITAIHTVIQDRCAFITYHGPMVCSELYKKDIDDFTMGNFVDSIFKGIFYGPVPRALNTNIKTIYPGICTGRLVGGNLSVICSSLGTPYELNTRGKILFLEEVREEPYKIDRLLNQLKLAGKLSEASGIVFGYFTDCGKNQESLILEIIEEIVKEIKVPCIYGICAGHSIPCVTLPLGAMAKIENNGLYLIP